MPYQGGQIGDLSVLAGAIELPYLSQISKQPGHLESSGRTLTLLSPPAVASLPFPLGPSKAVEYMGAESLCQATSNGAAFMM